ncbi:ATP-binding protein [Nonomuraea sp. NPDC050680]|uniref:ATP-binding protein n=1 Tax=Nonomuraea sp. NPDC050680 TaxID=3154630 RepID=UPI0034074766
MSVVRLSECHRLVSWEVVRDLGERTGTSMILTSNRAPMDWYPLFPNPVVAESLLDRLINTSHQVFMNGPSYRPNKRPGRVASTDEPDSD